MKPLNLGLASTIIDNILFCLYPGDPGQPPERRASVQVIPLDQAVLYVLYCTVSRWYPETKQDKAKQYYDAAVELFKDARYLDSFHLFQRAYKLSVLGEGIQNFQVCL